MSFQEIQDTLSRESEIYTNIPLAQRARGAMIGNISSAILGAATAAGIGYNNRFRDARLRLASEVYGRKVSSYNDLSDVELVALHRWVTTKGLELKRWLESQYGEQMKF